MTSSRIRRICKVATLSVLIAACSLAGPTLHPVRAQAPAELVHSHRNGGACTESVFSGDCDAAGFKGKAP